jgi:hypothetical protein
VSVETVALGFYGSCGLEPSSWSRYWVVGVWLWILWDLHFFPGRFFGLVPSQSGSSGRGYSSTRNFTAFPDATAIAYTEKTRQGYLLYGMQ